MSSLASILAKKQKEIASKRGGFARPSKPKTGKTRYRILPSWRYMKDGTFTPPAEGEDPEMPWHDFAQHWIKANKGDKKPLATFICTEKTFDRDCDVCMAIDKAKTIAKNSGDLAMEELMDEAKAGQTFLMNAVVIEDGKSIEDCEVVLLQLGSTAFDQILTIATEYAGDGEDIFCAEKGIDLLITRSGTGFDTKYTAMAKEKGSVPVPASVLAKMHNIDEFVTQDNEKAQVKALNSVAKLAGIEAPAQTVSSAPALTDMQEEVTDAEIIEAEAETVIEAEPEMKKAVGAEDIGSDSLDDLDIDDILDGL